MILRCPLCLTEVTTGAQSLVRFCDRHPERSEQVCITREDQSRLMCPDCGGAAPQSFLHGLFFRHIGCVGMNPYWRPGAGGGSLNVPKAETSVVRGSDAAVPIRHWELNLLRSVQESSAQNPVLASSGEMWFPVATIWATSDERPGRKKAALVELCGPKSVGKTVLTLMAMDYEGYLGMPGQSNVFTRAMAKEIATIGHYIFEPMLAGAEKPTHWLELLHLRRLMEVDQEIPAWPTATFPAAGNLRAVMFGAARKRKKNGLVETIVASVETFWLALAEIARAVKAIVTGKPWMAWRPHGSVVCFYDTAGERTEDPGDRELIDLDRVMDVVAVVVDAGDFSFADGPHNQPSTIAHAVQRLNGIMGRDGLRKCLIITKTDTLRGKISDREFAVMTSFTFDVGASEARPVSWLKAMLRRRKRSEAEAHLLQLLEDDVLDDVFIVWTEGVEPITATPHSFGLARFVAWCLEINVPVHE